MHRDPRLSVPSLPRRRWPRALRRPMSRPRAVRCTKSHPYTWLRLRSWRATPDLAADAVGVSLFAIRLWLARPVALAAAALYLRDAPRGATMLAMLAIAAAVSTPAHETVAPPLTAESIRNYPDGVTLSVEGRIDRAPQRYPDREYVFIDVERAGTPGKRLRAA